MKKLTFNELLENQEVLQPKQQMQILGGGGGVVLSGSGTAADPYVVQSNVYVVGGGSLHAAASASAAEINGGANITRSDGKVYKMSVSVYNKATYAEAQMAQSASVYSNGQVSLNYGSIMQAGDAGTKNGKPNYGSTDSQGNMTIDTAETTSVYSGIADFWNSSGSTPYQGQPSGVSQAEFVKNTTTHEMMHNLGLNDGPEDGLTDVTPIVTSGPNPRTIGMNNTGMGANSKQNAVNKAQTVTPGTGTYNGTGIFHLPPYQIGQ